MEQPAICSFERCFTSHGEQAKKWNQELECQLNVLTNDEQHVSLEDRGRRLYQDHWDPLGCSQALAFSCPACCTCASVEVQHSLTNFPLESPQCATPPDETASNSRSGIFPCSHTSSLSKDWLQQQSFNRRKGETPSFSFGLLISGSFHRKVTKL